jgi:GT2 family glycosyltransferase
VTTPENAPLVSVIMPVYNGMATLERAVRSVQAQTFADWELLVVDDCSTDGSREAVASWAAVDPRIRPLCSAENRGPGAARNLGLRSARGEFIAYLDGDDEYDPQYLEHVARLRDKGDVLVFGYDFVQDDGRSPHPDPLPRGEGTKGKPLPEGEGTPPSPCPLPEGEGTARTMMWRPEEHHHRTFATNIVVPLGSSTLSVSGASIRPMSGPWARTACVGGKSTTTPSACCGSCFHLRTSFAAW